MATELKIFQVSETDYWAGYDEQSVKDAYREQVGEEADDLMREFGEPYEFSSEEADKFVVTDVDEPGQPTHTGAEILSEIKNANRKVPCFVASTEY